MQKEIIFSYLQYLALSDYKSSAGKTGFRFRHIYIDIHNIIGDSNLFGIKELILKI